MGRASSTGLPYLVCRPDTGKYTYQRNVPPELQPLIAGIVSRQWAGKGVILSQPKTIKISLKTGDDQTAHLHWSLVHPQIETLFQSARKTLAEGQRQTEAQPVASLTAAEIQQMVKQAQHDILAADDDFVLEGQSTSPLVPVIDHLLRRDGRATPPTSVGRFAQDVERRRRDVKQPNKSDLARFDRGVEEFEIDADQKLWDEVLAVANSSQGRLSEAARRAILNDAHPVATIPSPVERLLTDNGISIDPKNQDRRRLALALLRGEASAHLDILARRDGRPIETPLRPDPIKPVVSGKTISQVRAAWVENCKPSWKTAKDNELYVRYFTEMHGDMPIRDIKKSHVKKFRDLLKKRPRNLPNKIAKLTLAEQVAWGEENNIPRLLAARTINAKGLGSVSTLMQFAIREDEAEVNPCKDLWITTKDAVPRLPYTIEDCNRIFSSPVYADGERPKGGGGEAAFWMPLIATYAGAREEEIGQLLVTDIRRKDGIDFFDFVNFDEAAEDAGKTSENKDIKTEAGRREVPIHPKLKELGFMSYVAEMRRLGYVRLLPHLRPYRDRTTKNFSRWWSRYAREHATKSRRKVFHSFRHMFADRLRNLNENVNPEDIASLLGHVTHMYGNPIGLKKRYNIICALDYPGLDLSKIQRCA